MIPVAHLVHRAGDSGVLPLTTRDEFFDGNDAEDSIAPNQCGYGRPTLAKLANRLRAIEQRADVARVRVQLHPETLELDELIGEAIAVCTTAPEGTCATWIEGFEASGLIPGLVGNCRDIPPTPDGAIVWSVVWDQGLFAVRIRWSG